MSVNLIAKIKSKKANIGIIGLGYVGLPIAIEFYRAGFPVTGFDTDPLKIETLQQGKSYIKHIDPALIPQDSTHFKTTTNFTKLAHMDCILICVPTPLSKFREPDMSYVFSTAETISRYLRKDQLISLESTTYPGTTDEDLKTILETNGLKAGVDYYLAYSPEREDPNNKEFSTRTTPKVVGGYTEPCLNAAVALYESIVETTIPVSSTKVAEATKLLENIYRSVNIALVNELKQLFERMGIDIWEVIEAAKTKPFGFQAFYPGPGLGGHCIPIDPFFLTWKAREFDFATRFIELAGEINTNMPYCIVEKLTTILNKQEKNLQGSNVLILGMAYKKDIDDKRESPSLKIIKLLREKGAVVEYSDMHVPVCRGLRHYPDINMESVELTEECLQGADVVLLLTDHSDFDYAFIEKNARCIVDTRNAFASRGIQSLKIHKA